MWLKPILVRLLQRVWPAARPSGHLASKVNILDGYIASHPSAQNAVDLVPGWNHAFPSHVGVIAGSTHLHNDARIHWCVSQFGSLNGCHVLELGPLEGFHTFILHQYGPSSIVCIEANKLSFLRCLITKEILEMHLAHYLLGDFVQWLEATSARYDLILASGILYHMEDPVRLLELLAERTDSVYIWTHYFSEEVMPEGDPRRGAFTGGVAFRSCKGASIRLHARGYNSAWQSQSFCGGMNDRHFWMERNQIVEVLGLVGFDDVRIAHDAPDHPNGPSISVFARRSESVRGHFKP